MTVPYQKVLEFILYPRTDSQIGTTIKSLFRSSRTSLTLRRRKYRLHVGKPGTTGMYIFVHPVLAFFRFTAFLNLRKASFPAVRTLPNPWDVEPSLIHRHDPRTEVCKVPHRAAPQNLQRP